MTAIAYAVIAVAALLALLGVCACIMSGRISEMERAAEWERLQKLWESEGR